MVGTKWVRNIESKGIGGSVVDTAGLGTHTDGLLVLVLALWAVLAREAVTSDGVAERHVPESE